MSVPSLPTARTAAHPPFRFRVTLLGLAIVTFLVSPLVVFGIGWMIAGRLVAPVPRPVRPPPQEFPFESVTIRSESPSELAAWYFPHETARATVILLHPLHGDRGAMLSRAKLLHDAGYATMAIDFQAHGESPGEYVTFGYRERLDVVAAVEFVRTRDPDRKIAIVGRSLGGAAALLASPLRIDALVLESVYASIGQAVHNRVSMRLGVLSHVASPMLLVQLKPRLGISASQLRPLDHIGNVECAVLIATGDCDLHATVTEAQQLYAAAKNSKQLIVFQGAAHQDLLKFDPEKYREIVRFLDSHLM